MMNQAKEKLIVALDVESDADAMALFELLREKAGMFKIGLQLFTAAGPDIVRQIVSRGGRIFLDLKFHDIPNTVAAAVTAATRLGVTILNVHAAGGHEMMKRAGDAAAIAAQSEGVEPPKVIAVTALTSLDQTALEQIGFQEQTSSVVSRLARLADAAGLDGVVASANEIEIIRSAVAGSNFLIVTPGIRSAGDVPADDQRRVMTAAEAIRGGADYLVVGRPIIGAADPVRAATELIHEIEAAKE